MSGSEIQRAPEVTLLKSEMEAAAARVAERAANTVLDGVTDVAGDFFGGLIGDRVKLWRTRRLVDGLIKTKDFLEVRGIPIENAKSLPMGEAFAIFDEMSKQDDPTLSEMWASLLANSMDPKQESAIDPSFRRMLSSISGLDAIVLKYIREYSIQWKKAHTEILQVLNQDIGSITKDKARRTILHNKMQNLLKEFIDKQKVIYSNEIGSFTRQNVSFSVSNLLRLGLIYAPEDEIPKILVNMSSVRDDGIIIDDRILREYLSRMQARMGMAIENQKKLNELTRKSPNPESATPNYSLSGYGDRFVEACTASVE